MKKYFFVLWQRKLMIIIITLLCGILGFVGVNSYRNPNADYVINFKYESEYQIDKIEGKATYENLEITKNEIAKIREEGFVSKGKYPYSSFDYVKINKISKKGDLSITKIEDHYQVRVKIKYFNTYQQARRFMTTYVSLEEVIGSKEVTLFESSTGYINKASDNSIIKDEKINAYNYLFIGLAIGLTISLATIAILYLIYKDKILDKVNYDNEDVYKYPIKLSYWKKATKFFKSPKDVIIISMFFAMMQVSKLIPLPSGFANLNISIGPLFFAILACIYGPVAGVVIGGISDIFGFFVFPTGQPFHPGYLLNAMLAGLIWGLCFYRTKITFSKILLARIIVNIGVNSILGSIWWGHISDFNAEATRSYMLITALPKNIVYLLPQSIVLFLIFKAVMPVFKHNSILPEEICDNVAIF